MPRVFGCPASGDAYVDCFYSALAAAGVEVAEVDWSGTRLLKNIRKGDFVHLHWPSFLYEPRGPGMSSWAYLAKFAAFLLLIRLRGGRLIWTAHNLFPHDGGAASKMHRLGRRLVVRLSSLVLVHGESARGLVASVLKVPEHKLCRVVHGHWVDYYRRGVSRSDARAKLGLPATGLIFGLVGLCKPYKNVEALVETAGQLGRDVYLLIAGEFQSSEYQRRIEDLMRRHGPERMFLRAGYIPDDELAVYLAAIDVMVLPYAEILTPGSAMLALSFGRPVVAPRLGSIEEMVWPVAGVLYSPKNPRGLETAMREAGSRSYDEASIIASARTFSWAVGAEALREAMRELDR